MIHSNHLGCDSSRGWEDLLSISLDHPSSSSYLPNYLPSLPLGSVTSDTLSFQYDQGPLPHSFDWLGFADDRPCNWAGSETSMINDSSHDALNGLPVSAACVLPLPSWELNTLPTPIASQDQSEASSVITSSPENHVSNTHSNGLPGMFSKPECQTTNSRICFVSQPSSRTHPHHRTTWSKDHHVFPADPQFRILSTSNHKPNYLYLPHPKTYTQYPCSPPLPPKKSRSNG